MSSGEVTVRRSPGLTIGIGIVVLALLGTAGWLLVDGRTSGAASAGTDEQVLAQADDEEAEDEEQVELATIDVTFDFFLSRDPFESIRPPEPPPAPSDPATAPSPSAPTSPTQPSPTQPSPTQPSPTQPSPTQPSPTPGNGACTTGAEAVCDGIVVTLQDVSASNAVVQVDGASYAVAPGDVFAQNFQLLSISGDCADVLYMNGDEADVFRLCDGESTSK